MQVAPLLKRAMSTKMKAKKKLLDDIESGKNGLSIENIFGKAAWQKFQKLGRDDEIVVVGNGPVGVSSHHGDYIDRAKMVIRCNHYHENGKCSGDGWWNQAGAKGGLASRGLGSLWSAEKSSQNASQNFGRQIF